MMARKKNDGIRLSPKYGVNPTIPICFWCGKSKNEIALMGRIGDGRKGEDFEAPKNVVLDYEPCDDCKEKWKLGVVLIEATEFPEIPNQQSFFRDKEAYPTGRWCVMKEEAFTRIFDADLPRLDPFNQTRRALLMRDVFEQIVKGET